VYYTCSARFTSDSKKAASNRRKHGVSFEEAATVFADPLATMLEDAVDPERAILVGQSESGRVLSWCSSSSPRTPSESSAQDALRLVRGNAMKATHKTRRPSRAALREMPEVNFDKARARRNPYVGSNCEGGNLDSRGSRQAEEGDGDRSQHPALGSISSQGLEAPGEAR
jgi:uncharacterized DUF497 family protein